MPNQNIQPNQIPSVSVVPYANFGVQFGANNANATARRIAAGAQPDPAWYQAAGGKPNVYLTPANAQGYYPMGQTGNQELAEIADARNVVPYMLANMQATFQEEISHGIITVKGTPAWTPGNELADVDTAAITVVESVVALVELGYDLPHAVDIAQQCLADYGREISSGGEGPGYGRNTPGSWRILDPTLVDPTGTAYYYSDVQDGVTVYMNITDGSFGGLEAGNPQIPMMGSVYLPFPSSFALREGPTIVQGMQGPYGQPANWKELLWNQIYGGGGLMMHGNPGACPAIGFENLTLAYRLKWGNQGDAKGSYLAQNNLNWLSYYDAVVAEAALIKQQVQQLAVAKKVAYGVFDYISSIPITPTDKQALKLGPRYNQAGKFPTRLQCWVITGYNGNKPIIATPADATPAKPYTAWYTPDYNGQPKLAPVMENPAFGLAFEEIFRSRVPYWFAMGGNQLVDGSDAGEWASVFKYALNPDSTPTNPDYALPHFADNNQWNGLAVALANGLVTDVQLANLFQNAVLPDFALKDLLGLVQGVPVSGQATQNSVNVSSPLYNADVASDFYDPTTQAGRNNATLRDAWLRVPAARLAPWTPTLVQIVEPPATPATNTIDVGPYGSIASIAAHGF